LHALLWLLIMGIWKLFFRNTKIKLYKIAMENKIKNTKYDHDKLYDLWTYRIKHMNWIQYNKLLNKKIKTLKLNESFITV
jgi:hypothetical protein